MRTKVAGLNHCEVFKAAPPPTWVDINILLTKTTVAVSYHNVRRLVIIMCAG